MGSLAASVGLSGEVEPEQFRAILDGRHPFSGEQLAPRRTARLRVETSDPHQRSLSGGDQLDVARTAARLRLTVGRVRQLLMAGQQEPGPNRTQYLRGEHVRRDDGRGEQWMIERSEVERFEATHLSQKPRPGYDLTLRPPKSVSVLWALAPEEVRREIRQAHEEAVDAVVDYVEGHALYARKRERHGQRSRIETDGLIAAAFDHRTSRAGDPLLHTHVVTANLTRTVEGRWLAINGRPLYSHARPAGVLYQAHLRHALTERLGIAWRPVRKGWAEVDGVPAKVIRTFSKRRDEIEAMVAESGYTSARAHQAATLASRRAKEYGVDSDELVNRWREEAAALGFGPDEVAACLERQPDADRARIDEPALRRFLAGPEGLTKLASTFCRKEVIELVGERVGSAFDASAISNIVDRFLASEHAVALAPDADAYEWVWCRSGSKERDVDLARWSTPELVHIEAELHQWAASGPDATAPTPRAETIEAVIAGRPSLNAEQATMVRSLASAGAAPIQPVSGRPGSGKTFATATYVRAAVADGIPIVGCALAATAAAELETSCQFGPLTGREASTIALLLREVQGRPLAPGTVIVVDEASMVGTRDLHQLAAHARAAGGSLKLIGDPKQHGAVETGGFFKHLCASAGDDLIRLELNNRQRSDDDRRSVEEFRHGLIEAALSRYDTNGHVHRCATAAATYDLMAEHWFAATTIGGRDPMIAGPNRVRSELNHRARRLMDDAGRLEGPTLTTEAGVALQAGDWIVTRRNQRSLHNRDGGWVKNGSTGTVVSVDPRTQRVTVDFDREGRITLTRDYVDTPGNVELGYARTTYGVQGATLERALYFAGDETSFEEGYVAFTRGRSETRLYLVDGDVAPDDEAGHRLHAEMTTGLDTVSAALRRERANVLAHDADPYAAKVRHGYHGWNLAQLRTERTRIEAVLAGGPQDVRQPHEAATAEHESLLARRRLHPTRAGRTAAGTVAALDDAIARSAERLRKLDEAQAARETYLTGHSEEVAAHPVIRRAELARELELRARSATNPPGPYVLAVGTQPAHPVAARAWRTAAELAAIHLDRYGATDAGATPTDATGAVLGSRPDAVAAALSWDRASEAIDAVSGLVAEPTRPSRRADPAVQDTVSILE